MGDIYVVFTQKPDIKKNFDSLSPGKQREFAEFVSSAKRESTKIRRIEIVMKYY